MLSMMKMLFLVLFLAASSFAINEPPYPSEALPESLTSRPKSYTFSVILEPLYLTVINSEVNSKVLKVHKKMGESFSKGDILMELDSRVYEGNYSKTLSLVTKFKTELDAKKILFADDALSQFELDDAIASLAGAQADFVIAKKLLENTKVIAPYNGRVVKLAVKEFELAEENKELITLVNDEELFAKFLVPSSMMQCLKQGVSADLYIRETGELITTKISRFSPVIDPSSSTIMVEAKLDNKDGRLWSGMSGRITILECNPLD